MFQIARAIKKYKIVHTGANIQSGGLKNGLFNREYQGSLNLIVIILFIVILFLKYKDISKFSAYLMIPYFLWCSYALILNFNLMILN